ncbi:MAG: formate dehydrogenase subunit gamma [Pseudazoarcus pumilus]|nr:formate dehydrogenase subunit gamma [Pseudazoarcus pumilus]
MSSAQPAWDRDKVLGIINTLKDMPGALMPILHGIQDSIGYVPDDAVPLMAEALNLSRAEVHGTITFYHHFRTTPPGRHKLEICRGEACQAVGANALVAHAKKTLGVDFHETTADGAVSLEQVFCLGNCACSPSLMVDGEVVGEVSIDQFDDIVDRLRTRQ